MRLLALSVAVVPLLPGAFASILTYTMAAHEKPCFYAESKYVEEKMSVYFGVQSGGESDLDYEVTAPSGTVVLTGTKEQTGDYVFSASEVGDYKFCFFNTVSSFSEKKFDFEILAQHEIPSRNHQSEKELKFEKSSSEDSIAKLDVSPTEQSIQTMHTHFGLLIRDLRYFRMRENRNFDTVRSTQARIFWFNIVQNGIIIVTALVQIGFIQTLFAKSTSVGGSSSKGGSSKGFSASGGYGPTSGGFGSSPYSAGAGSSYGASSPAGSYGASPQSYGNSGNTFAGSSYAGNTFAGSSYGSGAATSPVQSPSFVPPPPANGGYSDSGTVSSFGGVNPNANTYGDARKRF